MEIIEEIVRLHRIKAWEVSLERYPAVRRRLVSIQESPSKVTGEQKAVLAQSVEKFRLMQQKVERARSRNAQEGLDWARLNSDASRILDDLNRVMISIRQAAD
ncbi:hypothetical protein SBA4_2910011 [Candidatus Sulfopaludibacter sp. SbA4]|nr:hypothetical protein SBA4_2910011 [Candidatus Sulfopaludibacter sp. SbA4]